MNLTQIEGNFEDSLRCFYRNKIELIIKVSTGEVFASQSAMGRMCGVSETAIRKFITSNQIEITSAQIPTKTGTKTSNLLSEDAIYSALEKYNPSLLKQCAKVGLRAYLHKLVGFEHPIASQQSSKDLYQDFCDITDLIFRGLKINPEQIAEIKLNQAQRMFPDLSQGFLPHKKLLSINESPKIKPTLPYCLGKNEISNILTTYDCPAIVVDKDDFIVTQNVYACKIFNLKTGEKMGENLKLSSEYKLKREEHLGLTFYIFFEFRV